MVQTRKVGTLEVTVVGLGTNNFGMGMPAEDVEPVVNTALDQGVNFFDTSDSYGASEERLGQALRRRRDDIVIATKFGSPVRGQEGTGGAQAGYVKRAAEASLKRLGTDRIDLYQIHRPDPQTPIAETLEALAELIAEGKVREIGCSNFSAAQLREAHAAAGTGPRFASVQNHYNLLNRQDEADVIPTCVELGLVYLPYFPLASGVLTGKYKRGEKPPEGTRLQRWGERAAGALNDETFDKVEALSGWAKRDGHGLLDLAIAWLIGKPYVASVIAGATKPEQVIGNVGAASWQLSPSQVAEVDAIAGGAK
jgi:aryl-alcohol dehydrogenase-like predicted oxidoreductase